MTLHLSQMTTYVSRDGNGKDEVIVRYILFNIIYVIRNQSVRTHSKCLYSHQ
jgi:hypothetical protein